MTDAEEKITEALFCQLTDFQYSFDEVLHIAEKFIDIYYWYPVLFNESGYFGLRDLISEYKKDWLNKKGQKEKIELITSLIEAFNPKVLKFVHQYLSSWLGKQGIGFEENAYKTLIKQIEERQERAPEAREYQKEKREENRKKLKSLIDQSNEYLLFNCKGKVGNLFNLGAEFKNFRISFLYFLKKYSENYMGEKTQEEIILERLDNPIFRLPDLYACLTEKEKEKEILDSVIMEAIGRCQDERILERVNSIYEMVRCGWDYLRICRQLSDEEKKRTL